MKKDKIVEKYRNYWGSFKEQTDKLENTWLIRRMGSDYAVEHPMYNPTRSQKIKNKK